MPKNISADRLNSNQTISGVEIEINSSYDSWCENCQVDHPIHCLLGRGTLQVPPNISIPSDFFWRDSNIEEEFQIISSTPFFRDREYSDEDDVEIDLEEDEESSDDVDGESCEGVCNVRDCLQSINLNINVDDHWDCYCKTRKVCGCGCDARHDGW